MWALLVCSGIYPQDSVSNETQKDGLFYCDAPRFEISPPQDQICPNPAGFSQELRTCFCHQDLGADNMVEPVFWLY